ncbi:MAG: Rieske (2Fe-2S) protein [Leptolyngbyaceae cyanobacterium MO_188.B28]|nr:Rieske (2Fe-2S) protein [Leptolyngbyaceae cyanobacterium MO_188.B28]
MNRRDFMAWVGVGFLGSSLPVAIAACSSKSGSREFERVGSLAELDASGQLLNETTDIGPVLVIRDPDNSDTVRAVNPVCPHARCTVAWQAEKTRFTCPCHGSEFDLDGAVARGPAREALGVYAVKLEGNQILAAKSS